MSVNKFMHPRNIYKVAPDFVKLARVYPDFALVCQMDLSGIVKFNFKDEKSLRLLTKCLLHRDFGLTVDLPANKLVPTLPLRLNYLLWIEDICERFQLTNICGVDIGCGASCIYPLLGASKNNWKFYALESNQDSLRTASQNVSQNNLNDRIIVLEPTQNSFFDRLHNDYKSSDITFSMCNPPFFASEKELAPTAHGANRTENRKPPKNAMSGCLDELVYEGGELNFIRQMILESTNTKQWIKFYTTMLGHKYCLKGVRKILREYGVTNFTTTEFCQGNTTRWGLAWTFCDNLLLRDIDVLIPKPPEIACRHILAPPTQASPAELVKAIHNILIGLNVNCLLKFESETQVCWNISACHNSWSNQRRKRRIELQSPPVKRQRIVTDPDMKPPETPLLISDVLVRFTDGQIAIEFKYLNGSMGKEGCNQILQFIKNNLKYT